MCPRSAIGKTTAGDGLSEGSEGTKEVGVNNSAGGEIVSQNAGFYDVPLASNHCRNWLRHRP